MILSEGIEGKAATVSMAEDETEGCRMLAEYDCPHCPYRQVQVCHVGDGWGGGCHWPSLA